MRHSIPFVLTFMFFSCTSTPEQTINIGGLTDSVEIIRDQWGVNHIYAKNQNDLFFAQGYAAAKDRLFQFEIWRRQATGTVAEILGERAIARDYGTRLFRFRGDMVDGRRVIELKHNVRDAWVRNQLCP